MPPAELRRIPSQWRCQRYFGTLDAATGGYVHDLLVVYTPAAKARYGQATLESMIQNAVQAANQAYQNSAIGITLNLVGLKESPTRRPVRFRRPQRHSHHVTGSSKTCRHCVTRSGADIVHDLPGRRRVRHRGRHDDE